LTSARWNSRHGVQPYGHATRSLDWRKSLDLEVAMKLFHAAALLALLTSPALAAQDTPTLNGPSAQNSGAGISGQPGGKNGPATDGRGQVRNSDQTNSARRLQDSAKIPGKAGGKSGPAVMPPSSTAQKP
jgi:hypothetical protein